MRARPPQLPPGRPGPRPRDSRASPTRGNLGLLPDSAPFALFPVRLETRFSTEQIAGETPPAAGPHLPGRLLDRHLRAEAVGHRAVNAQRYWQNIWRAGGVEADERAAWRDWSRRTARAGPATSPTPTSPPTWPASRKTAASDEILVIPTQAPLAAADAAAISTYWTAAWTAAGDAAAQQAAERRARRRRGPARAAELLASYVPFNLSDLPAPPLTTHDVAVTAAFVVFPADPPPKPAPWTQAPHVAEFPERFVVLGYQGGEQVLEAIGGPVTPPLYVGPDPSADPAGDSIHPDGDDLLVPDQLAWLVDFPAAQAAGLGLAIDLSAEQAGTGFDRLLVLGVQLGAGADGAAALEELLAHHRAGRSGLALVPLGTPTHNTTGAGAGYISLEDADESFADRANAPLFTPTRTPPRSGTARGSPTRSASATTS